MITREDCVEQSVQNFVKDGLDEKGYGTDMVLVRDAFPTATERASELTKTTVAVGFNFDDGGKKVELGSELTSRIYTIEFWVFGLSPTWGRNVANVIRFLIEAGGMTIPLYDISDPDADDPIDNLQVQEERGVSVARQVARDPMAWDNYVWTVTLRVEDIYFPSDALIEDFEPEP